MGSSTAILLSLLGSLGVQVSAKNGGSAINITLLSIVLFVAGSVIFAVTSLTFCLALRRNRAKPERLLVDVLPSEARFGAINRTAEAGQ